MKKFKIIFMKYIFLLKAVCRKGRISNLFLIIGSYLLKRSEVKGLPCVFQIEPTNKCDLRCRLCLTGLGKLKRPKGEMTFNAFKNILRQVENSLIYLALYNMGEPLLNPDIYNMISYAKQKGVFIRLSTNANFSGRKHIKNILNSGIDELIISLDCATAQTYSEYKNSPHYDRVIDNVRLIVKERGSRPRPLIKLQFLLMKSTEGDIDIFKKLVKELAVDQGIMKKVRVDFYGVNPRYDALAKNKKYVRDVYKNKRQKMTCWRPWLSTVILWDGKVAPCCFDMEGEFGFGNIAEQSMSSIWNNRRYVKFREKIAKNSDVPAICHQCSIKNFRKNFI